MTYLKDNYAVKEERLYINDIPCIRLTPIGKEGKYKTVIFYHGLGSSKDSQRMRGHILAFCGYQVLLPDAIHHGERDEKYSEDELEVYRYFRQAILQNVKESDILIDKIINDFNGDAENIFVSGHSMGGFTAAGVFTHNPKIKGAIPLNGSFNWEEDEDLLNELEQDKLEKREAQKLNPMNNLDKLINRNILILHGEKDTEVDIELQRKFYNTIKDKTDKITMIEYENLGHFCTTNMMEDLIKWLKGLE